MAIVVEDGTVVTTANSYITRADFITYAAEVGVTVADEAATDVYLVKAFKFIETLEGRLKSHRVYELGSNAFPRIWIEIDDYWYGSDDIPQVVIDLQCELALDLIAGVDLYNLEQSDGSPVRREKIHNAVEVEYAVAMEQARKRNSLSRELIKKLVITSGLAIPVSLG